MDGEDTCTNIGINDGGYIDVFVHKQYYRLIAMIL